MKLYEKAAQQLEEQIQKGVYRPGDKLPSVRHLSRQLKVSISTVLQAYTRLEDLGIIKARPQSGFYVQLKQRPTPAAPAISRPRVTPTRVNTIDLALEVLHATNRRGLAQFGTAVPGLDFPALNNLHRLFSSITRRWPRRVAAYEFPPGSPELRRQIARRSVDSGLSLSPDDMIITNGCQEALMLAIRVVAKPGDIIAVESPGYYGALQNIQTLGMKALEIPTDPSTGISLEALSLALEQWPIKACVLTPQLSNPLGHRMPDKNKIAVLELLRKHDISLIEDDINGELIYGEQRNRAIKSWDEDGRVILCSSFSKTLEPGLRVGWIVPGRYLRDVEHLKVVTSMATATLPQLAVAEFLEAGGYDRHLRQVRNAYRQRRDQLLQLISRHFPENVKATCPDGGFLSWIELPEGVDSMALLSRALDENISLAPGPLFSAKGKYQNFMRLNFGTAWDQEREQGIQVLGELVEDMLNR